MKILLSEAAEDRISELSIPNKLMNLVKKL